MSQVKFAGNASGSGSVTIQSPNTNSAYTQTLQAVTGVIPVVSSSVAVVTGAPIYENTQTVGTSYSITSGSSAMSAGPITLSSGVTVTLPAGSRWVIV
jgi:hypothetical protein